MVLCFTYALALEPVDAEGVRLAESMQLLAESGTWAGVEKKYVEIVRGHPRALEGRLHLLAAQAAQSRGDLLAAAQRLQRVQPKDPAFDLASAELTRLAYATRLVLIENPDRLPWKREEMPFEPPLRLAVEAAATAIDRDGYFVGLLPRGVYTLGEVEHTVGSGFEWSVIRNE